MAMTKAKGEESETGSADDKGQGKGRGSGKAKGKCTNGKDGKGKASSRDSSADSRRSVSSSGKPRSTRDPKLARTTWIKGKCKKSDADRPMAHNPPCYFAKNNKTCELGHPGV